MQLPKRLVVGSPFKKYVNSKETEFELQSMKKETAGTAELLDQFFRVEVGVRQYTEKAARQNSNTKCPSAA